MGHIAAIDLDAKAVRPLHDECWIRIDDREEFTPSGLVALAHVARPLPNVGTVIRIGSEVTTVQPGDSVRFDKTAHTRLEPVFIREGDGKEGRYLKVRERDIDFVIDGGTLVQGTEK